MLTFKKLIYSLLLIASVISSVKAEEFAVIVNKNQDVDQLTRVEVQNIYLSKTGSFPNGSWVIPVDHKKGAAQRVAFYQKVLERTEAQLKSYFSRLVFTGKGAPPRVLQDDASVIRQVQANESVIGYVQLKSVDDETVRVVFKF